MKTNLLISFLLLTIVSKAQPYEQFKGQLIAANTTGWALADGNSVVFDNSFSNSVDNDDATKQSNFGENFGILRDGITLAIEARKKIVSTDTVYYRMWNIKQQNYQLRFVPLNMVTQGLSAKLRDNFLGTEVPVSVTDTSIIPFTVTSTPASFAQDRFKIIFNVTILALDLISLNAHEKDKSIYLNWTVAGKEENISYEVEHSTDGRMFTSVARTNAGHYYGGSTAYSWVHSQPGNSINYYRVKRIERNGYRYSGIVKLANERKEGNITIAPNPVSGSDIRLQFNQKLAGLYTIRITNSLGQLLSTRLLWHTGGSSSISILPGRSLNNGSYHLHIIDPGGKRQILPFISL